MAVYASGGMVATSQPLAAQAGLEMLRKGGNAVDAAIATAASLTVLEPTSNGIGGDAFALIWFQGRLYGLNASGPAPKGISLEAVKRAGHAEMPRFGWLPVTVPGAPAAWAACSGRFGRLPLTEVLAPAIRYAEEGFPLTPVLGKHWKRAAEVYRRLDGDLFAPWFDTFAPGGDAPEIGERWRSPDHAKTLQAIAETRAEAFYRGELAERIDAFSRTHGGYLRAEDLAAFSPEWVTPIQVNYRGFEVWELPPNGQGLITLMALNLLKGFDPAEFGVASVHRQIEAIKLAFADGKRWIADPRCREVPVAELLSDAYAEERRKQIGERASDPLPGSPPRGGTVYLAAADGEGNMVSFIQSNYMGFGSGLVVPGTGISLHNRGCNFTLDPGHPNCLEPGKRPYHTIIPGFLTRDGRAVGSFGVMGGFMQPQGHLQVIVNTIDRRLNPQAALDAPRWQWVKGREVLVEQLFPNHIAEALVRKGHDIRVLSDSASFGRGQIIWRIGDALVGGTEPRADGGVAAF
ncbi:gamma-glutamyltransferase family protein [Planifilum fimeticola]|nr:gamma-glutamyltransferase family protein [Planifilum fimeticola]